VVAEWIADERLAKTPSKRVPQRQLELLVTDVPASFSVVAGRFLGGDASDAKQVDLVAR
jgi:hypothetical protein